MFGTYVLYVCSKLYSVIPIFKYNFTWEIELMYYKTYNDKSFLAYS